MDNAKQIVKAWDNGEIHYFIPEAWAKATGKTDPIALARFMISTRCWMWPTAIISILAIFTFVGWPFDSDGTFFKAGPITLFSAYLILGMIALPIMGYTALDDFIDLLEKSKHSEEMQRLLAEITRTKAVYERELSKSRHKRRLSKSRIRRRPRRKRRVRSKMSRS